MVKKAVVRRSRRRAARSLLSMVIAAAAMAIGGTTAKAATGEHLVSGEACHNYSYVNMWRWWAYLDADCLTINAATGGAALGRAELVGIKGDMHVPLTLDCLVVETRSWGHRAFASGTDDTGTAYALVVSSASDGRSGFAVGAPTGPAPCGAQDIFLEVDGGSFHIGGTGTQTNVLPAPAFTYSCDDDLRCTFDASDSFDPDGSITSYRWQFPGYDYSWEPRYATGRVVSETFRVGTHSVLLTVVDDDGGAEDLRMDIQVGSPPTASFSFACVKLTCDFDASASSDSDGSIVHYRWYFGDGTWIDGSSPTATHTYSAPGSYSASLRVTDDDGAWASTSVPVEIVSPPFDLVASGRKQGNQTKITLTWTGALTDLVDVYREGTRIATVSDSGSYSEQLPRITSSVTYRVCDRNSSRCSNDSTVLP